MNTDTIIALIDDRIEALQTARAALVGLPSLIGPLPLEKPARLATPKAPKARKATPARPSPALGGTALAILDALKAGPLSPKELAQKTRVDPSNITPHLRELREAGKVTAEGATLNRRYQLA